MLKTVLFVDSQIKDYPSLLVGLGSELEVDWLNATEDGILQKVNIFYEELINAS